jgi:hypothetical protein
LVLLPGAAFPQTKNLTDDLPTSKPSARHNYIGMAREAVNPANGSVSFRLDMGGVA